jgi:single-stranded-DNA-specific exonuclease
VWRLLPPPALDGYADAGEALPGLVRGLLTHRGVNTTEAARRFLGSPQELTDPRLMPNLEVAVTRLVEACERGESVAIFGDYDVDGVTATCVLFEGLTALGAKPLPYLPDRFTEGYGLNSRAVRQLADRGATLLVTADTGTSAVAEIAEATAHGLNTVVIDHHTIPSELPQALAIVNPKLNDLSYGSEPAAVGVAYKVIHDLHDRLGRPYDPEPHRALVTLGTICDVAPLVAENRDLVRIGLDALARTDRPGLRALFEVARVQPDAVTVETVGWALGPRLNAAGRMAHARLALELLVANTLEEARPRAAELERLNEARRDATVEALEAARTLIATGDPDPPLIIVESPDISSGIVGLVAGRLVDQYARPAIVMQVGETAAVASCRSIPGFDVAQLLDDHHDLFLRHGGHRAAAGFTIEIARIPELRQRLLADAAERLDPAALTPAITVDAELPLGAITPRLIQWLQLMEPHGEGNRRPVFLARGVEVVDSRLVGGEGTHLQLRVRSGGEGPGSSVVWRCISFGNGEHAVPVGERADLVYSLKRDDFREAGGMQLEVLDLRRATA